MEHVGHKWVLTVEKKLFDKQVIYRPAAAFFALINQLTVSWRAPVGE